MKTFMMCVIGACYLSATGCVTDEASEDPGSEESFSDEAALAATTPQEAAPSDAQYCVTVIGKAPSPNEVSPVLYEYCSNKSEEDAKAHLGSPEAVAKLGSDAQLSSTDLVRLWQHAGWSGTRKLIQGLAGPCDSAGYRIGLSTWWQNNLSSVSRLTRSCNMGRYVNKMQTSSRTLAVPTRSLGSLDNNVHHFQVFDGT